MTKISLCLLITVLLTACSRLGSQPVSPGNSPSNTIPAQSGWDPVQACAFLSDKLRPGPYRNEGGVVFGCMSTARNIGSAQPLPNNIVYHVRGDATRAREARLILNVNDVAAAAEAQRVLLEYSQQLSEKALGVPLSQRAAEAITKGVSGSGRVDTTKVEILHHAFSNGKGYEMHFVLTPKL